MLVRPHLASLAVVVALAGSAMSQTVDLSEGPLVDNFFHVELSMKLTGATRVQQAGKTIEQKVGAEALHEFSEKILHVSEGIVDKTVRTYKNAQALVSCNGENAGKRFRPERTLLVTQRLHGQNLTYSPYGSLTREELELTEHFNTLALTGLLPGRAVKAGDSWPVSKNAAQALCGLEGLVGQDLTCTLENVKGDVAQVKVGGTVTGIDLGVDVKIDVQANYQFNLGAKRLVYLNWKQKDEREQGPASPALSADVDIIVRRGVVEQPAELGSVVLGGLLPQGPEPPAEMLLISHADPARRFEIQYERQWIMTAQSREQTVWRLMNRGDLVAQATATPWHKLEPGRMMSMTRFEEVIQGTTGWREERLLQKKELKIEGHRAYRHDASGKLDGTDVMQYFYLIGGPNGEQLFVTFTMSPNQVKELNFRHEAFLSRITFPVIEAGK